MRVGRVEYYSLLSCLYGLVECVFEGVEKMCHKKYCNLCYIVVCTDGTESCTELVRSISFLKRNVSVHFGVRTFRLNLEPKFSDFRYRTPVPEISGHWIASNVSVMTLTIFGTPKPENVVYLNL